MADQDPLARGATPPLFGTPPPAAPGSPPTAPAAGGSPGPAALAPAISLPKGGGAVRGIGEKFAANPVTGTASLTVPVATSPGRDGFGPDLSLAYDSGSGNGVFGFGWSLSVPAIARKTDKGVPTYDDAVEADVFLLSGAEDLVAVRGTDGERLEDRTSAPGYVIYAYRPRVEHAFARVERWVRTDGDVHWRSLTRDNVLSVYGADPSSRVSDPDDARRVFSWLLSETRDDRGNAVVYAYAADDGEGVDLSKAHQRHRGAADDPRRTTARYLKRIRYGNRVPLLDGAGRRPLLLTDAQIDAAGWMFEVVLDYDEGHLSEPVTDADGRTTVTASASPTKPWAHRGDAFSSYRSGFELRTTRRCERILMFHHVPADPEIGVDCLVRSTELGYLQDPDPAAAPSPSYTFLRAVTHRGYRRSGAGYLMGGLPPVEFSYSPAVVHPELLEVPRAVVGEPPSRQDPATQFVDLYGEGLTGILAERAGGWFYRTNLSPVAADGCAFSEPELVPTAPGVTLASARFLDLAGDGRPDLVVFDEPAPGFYERRAAGGWESFRPFTSRLSRPVEDPRLRFADLDGDGLNDVLITDESALVWHRSLGEEGYGPGVPRPRPTDEEVGPSGDFSSREALFLADMTADGLADFVRIRNGEVCFWPSLGEGRFGAKVTMDRSPWFDGPDQFDPDRLRLGDVDGTGSTDLVYLGSDGVHLYFNESGNAWSAGARLDGLPGADQLTVVELRDLLGAGTACLVWSSPAPGDAAHPLRYVQLMGPDKPHLLAAVTNNLGAETAIRYAPSTRDYLADRAAGDPWLSPLPFPVHVVARVETRDAISGSVLVTRYAYHHGYFDGDEREFRGFGLVDQWDAEETGRLGAGDRPPVLTRTWFHNGVDASRGSLADRYRDQYYAGRSLLAESTLPPGLDEAEQREAWRALRGAVLRQEVYADDAGPGAGASERARAATPYSVTEARYEVRLLQAGGPSRHAAFFTHGREAVTATYERSPEEPRVRHTLTLDVDAYGNTLAEAVVAYGRRTADPRLAPADAERQARTLVTLSEHAVTNAVDTVDTLRAPLLCEVSSFELTGFAPSGADGRYQPADLRGAAVEIPFHVTPGTGPCRRLLKRSRTLYRSDDLTSLLPLGRLESRATAGEDYGLVFTDGFLDEVFRRSRAGQAAEPLLVDPTAVLGPDGGYLSSATLRADGRFPAADPDDRWWSPGGRSYLSTDPADGPAVELAEARSHFFRHRRYRDAFGEDTRVDYDDADVLLTATQDPLGNRIMVDRNDYRVLQPRLVSDANGNQVEVAYDVVGLVAGRAAMGKPAPAVAEGDSLAGFLVDLTPAQVDAFAADPGLARDLLGAASTRIVYDLDRFRRTRRLAPDDPATWQPAYSATVSREVHATPAPPQAVPVQVGFTYSDGWGRVIQRKAPAAAGPVTEGGGVVDPRWVGSGWTVFDNKDNPVREYEPFFSTTHTYEPGVLEGVSTIRCYDPPGRLVATLHPDHTYEKSVFDAWQQTTYDATDTCAPHGRETGDPRTDPDVAGLVAAVLTDPAWQPWYAARIGGDLGPDEKAAAERAAAHADTPLEEHLDGLGRTFLTVRTNRVSCAGHDDDGTEVTLTARTERDVEGRELVVRDAGRLAGDEEGRVLARYRYDMAGNRVHQLAMDAGERWMLADVSARPIRAWDDRGHELTHTYDALRRPVEQTVRGTTPDSDPRTTAGTLVVGRVEYGESVPGAEALNLRTRAYRELDAAGTAVNARLDAAGNPVAAYDFKGNQRFSTRRLLSDYRGLPDWSADPDLGPETFETSTAFDALDRPVQTVLPHQVGTAATVVQPTYDAGNQVARVDVWLARPVPLVDLLDPVLDPPSPVGVAARTYDAQGRCTSTALVNGLQTTYHYDALSRRLARLTTTGVQDLGYTYDAGGNITHVHDAVQQDVFFLNRLVEPDGDYVYDSLNRLVQARGREHLGQQGPVPYSSADASLAGQGVFAPGDGNAMGAYVERYGYDLAGNLLRMKHVGANPVSPGWTRELTYAEESLAEAAKQGNRLTRAVLNPDGGQPLDEPFDHDPHGNVVRMSHLGGGQPGPNLHWDHRDQLRKVDLGGGGTAYYVYDSGGRRVRKVWEKAPGLIEERIYLGGFELFRRHGAPIGAGSATLARETVHVTVAEQRVALVETRTLDTSGHDPAPTQLVRYQLANHVYSSSLEVDDQARIISYEEYSPFGSTTYQAVRSQTEAPKRFRYTGRERDEETGLYYNGARYLACWLGRWTAHDPIGLKGGTNGYAYCNNDPLRHLDPLGMDEWCGLSDGFFGMFSSECHLEPHIAGGIKTVGGGLETLGGGAMVLGGAATCEVGVGCFVAAAGVAVTAHGLDTTQSGFRSAIHGEQVDSFTSEGLQAAGMSRRSANLVDAGLSVAGSLGASAATRAPAVAGALAAGEESTPAITVALRPALGPGHNYVAVTAADGTTTWSHLAVSGATGSSGGSVVTGGTAVVQGLNEGQMVSRLGSSVVVRVPVTAAQADAALAVVNNSIQVTEAAGGSFGAYSLTANSCSTYAASVMRAGGVATPSLTSPTVNLLSASLRSPTVVQAVSTSGTAVSSVTFAANTRESLLGVGTAGASTPSPTAASTGLTGIPDPAAFSSYDAFRASVSGPYTETFVMQQWATAHGWKSQ